MSIVSTASSETAAGSAETSRFREKRERIVDAASVLIARHGVRGLTFVDVAQEVDLNTTSITYYFKRKELLAAATFERALVCLDEHVETAGREGTPQDRVAAFLSLSLDHLSRIRKGEARPVSGLSDMRAMDEPVRSELFARFMAVFRKVRAFFGDLDDPRTKSLNIARAHVLVENVFWLPAWLPRYSAADFERVNLRLFELFERGLAPDGAVWMPDRLHLPEERQDDPSEAGLETFLRAATRLMNERGYRGASVERIASEINVTKGSFYHHLDGKDALVLECFQRSYNRVSQVQHLANAAGGSHWHRLSSTVATLLDIQFEDSFPLLRTTALQVLPAELRSRVVDRSNRMARRFAGMMIDGITEGSIRPIDPLIASQALMAMLNAAIDLRRWADGQARPVAIRDYASTLAYGLFREPPQDDPGTGG